MAAGDARKPTMHGMAPQTYLAPSVNGALKPLYEHKLMSKERWQFSSVEWGGKFFSEENIPEGKKAYPP